MEVCREGKWACGGLLGVRVEVLDGVEQEDVGGVAARCFETGFDGGTGVIVWCDEDNATVFTRCAVGHGRARGDAGGEMKGEEGFANAGVAVEVGEVAQGDALFPKPGERLYGDVGEESA